ncbi:XRE family transcriptional regulator [Streptosporangium sp. NBC_01755]|uniref:XRE family transcriptional regulator n=1 Tax=Streptosporangium sp. NBC_01755 TaxID=2975949 RepID=UPI002DD92D5E|nr:XRE family transcriptional regulator [Streptosporangium sp. NBC_01755]WSC97361.1 XRE family transcriptional regulator [Streptosporangium sp. NBC_01755]
MATISRMRRAELSRRAQEIRRQGQRQQWPLQQIASAIVRELPQVLPLEAWRWALGWSRAQTISEIAEFYERTRIGESLLNASMLCKYEHGEITPGHDYTAALCAVYQADPAQLGLHHSTTLVPHMGGGSRAYRDGRALPRPRYTDGDSMTADHDNAILAALRDSVTLALEVEGPAGGPLALENLAAALAYYDVNYSAFPPGLLAIEVHRTRALVSGMLKLPQLDGARVELRRLAGWLSALVGNLAFHLSDYPAAAIHFATAARLGTAVGDNDLICWSLGAQAMTAYTGNRPVEALELAQQAYEYAETPLRRAQILAWGQLRSLAYLGESSRSDAALVMANAQRKLEADPDGERPGRFGFDRAELQLHLAETNLQLGDHAAARGHAETSRRSLPVGRPGWAAATLVLARAEAARGQLSDAAALGIEVLDVIPAPALRETSRVRLRDLNHDLFTVASPGVEAEDLQDRIRALPALMLVGRISDEPNGQRS